MEHQTLGRWDDRPSDAAYDIEDCRKYFTFNPDNKFYFSNWQLHEEGIINNLSKKWMRKNSGFLCDSNLAEGIPFQTVFILLVMLLSGTALSLLLMFGEWFVHSRARKTNRNVPWRLSMMSQVLWSTKSYGTCLFCTYYWKPISTSRK